MRPTIEEKFLGLEQEHKGAVIVEIPMLMPVPKTQLEVADMLVKSGIDLIQVSVPIRFPWMYGTRILDIQKKAAQNDVGWKQSFEVLKQLIEKYPQSEFMPVGFYGGLQRMGQDNYVRRCSDLGIRIVDVPDYPLVHDDDPRGLVKELRKNAIDYVEIISTNMTKAPKGSDGYNNLVHVIENCHGFCFLLASAGGKTGEKATFDYDGLFEAKSKIQDIQKMVGRICPIVAVCGISTPEQVRILTKQVGLHVMFGSSLFTRIMNGDSRDEIMKFLQSMKEAAC